MEGVVPRSRRREQNAYSKDREVGGALTSEQEVESFAIEVFGRVIVGSFGDPGNLFHQPSIDGISLPWLSKAGLFSALYKSSEDLREEDKTAN